MRRALLLFAAVLMLALLAAAGDPWKEKKYTEWTDKDVQKLLTDSPWGRLVILRMGGPAAPDMSSGGGRGMPGGGAIDAGEAGGGGFGEAGGGGFGGGGGRGGRGGRGGGTSGSSAAGEIRLFVRWQSSLPVRQALARNQLISGRITQERADQFVSQKPGKYVVAVSGLPRMAMGGASLEKVKGATRLKIGSGETLNLEDVRVSQGDAVELYFFFPRVAELDPAVAKSVEFITTLGRLEVRRKFNLKDMMFDGKLEL